MKVIEKKELIIRSFLSLVSSNGINRVTLNEVAKKSGLTKSGLYYYFSSKEDLFLSAVDLAYIEIKQKIETELNTIKNSEDKLFEYIKLKIDLVFDKSSILSFFSITSAEILDEIEKFIFSSPKLIKRMKEIHTEEAIYVKTILKKMLHKTEVSDKKMDEINLNLHIMTEGLIYSFKKFMYMQENLMMNDPIEFNKDDFAKNIASIFLYGLTNNKTWK